MFELLFYPIGREGNMAEKQKPEYDLVKRAARLMSHPQDATHEDIKRLAARVMSDEKNAPDQNKTVPKPKAAAKAAAKPAAKAAAAAK
jgi:hypothetical protein